MHSKRSSRFLGSEGKFVRGFYPLPGGSATVVFRPINGPDGSFALVSDGKRFGEEGYYRSHRTTAGALRVKCLLMGEVVRIFVGAGGALRAEHTFAFGGVPFLTLRYEISRRDRL